MKKKQLVTYDTALPIFAEIVLEDLGPKLLESGLFLRDVSGKLTFVVPDENWEASYRQVSERVASEIPNYVDGAGYAFSTPDQLFDTSLKDRKGAATTHLVLPRSKRTQRVWLVDRRAVGQDWLQQPSPRSQTVPIVVFASIKGGVGRSTALCVLAAHLASKGRRVLAVDMDLEAPGLGTMLLSPETMPKFGLLDYIVEAAHASVSDELMLETAGPSWLAAGRGRIDVVPAVGSTAGAYPENVLSKIARAYLASNSDDIGAFSHVVSDYLARITADSKYDVVLVDARAGLHETTASAILGLGGDVYLFSVNQPQTIAGYNYLLSHVASRTSKEDGFWGRLHFVQAKSLGEKVDSGFSDAIELILKTRLFSSKDKTPDLDDLADDFEVDWVESSGVEDSEAGVGYSEFMDEISFISIPESESYRSFDPLLTPDLLQHSRYSQPYSEFLSDVEGVVDDYYSQRNSDAS